MQPSRLTSQRLNMTELEHDLESLDDITQRSPIRDLPQEILDIIIDSLETKASLCSTSLVCRKWLIRSHVNLFRSIRILLLESALTAFDDFLSFLESNVLPLVTISKPSL
ncbi:hypothetical protein ABKN59_001532 [Abortiporus biennis]